MTVGTILDRLASGLWVVLSNIPAMAGITLICVALLAWFAIRNHYDKRRAQTLISATMFSGFVIILFFYLLIGDDLWRGDALIMVSSLLMLAFWLCITYSIPPMISWLVPEPMQNIRQAIARKLIDFAHEIIEVPVPKKESTTVAHKLAENLIKAGFQMPPLEDEPEKAAVKKIPPAIAILISLFFVSMLLTACDWPENRITPSPTPGSIETGAPSPVASTSTEAATPTATDWATLTAVPFETPTADGPQVTPTGIGLNPYSIDPTGLKEVQHNGDFEGLTRSVIFPEVNVFTDWEPFYCDQPYTPQKCAIPIDWNPSPETNGVMRRPEYKLTDITQPSRDFPTAPIRVFSTKTAQQWFCYFGVCDAGIFQKIETVPGKSYLIVFHGMTWSSASAYGTGGRPFTSDTATIDQRSNSIWYVKVDLHGGANAYADNLIGTSFDYSFGHYDQYAEMRYIFTATDTQTTVFFGNLRHYAIEHNDSYIDAVRIYELGATVATAQPSPQPVFTPTKVDLGTKDSAIEQTVKLFTPNSKRNIYSDHKDSSTVYGTLAVGQSVTIYAIWNGKYRSCPAGCKPDHEQWLCTDPNLIWVTNPDFQGLLILQCGNAASHTGWIQYAFVSTTEGKFYGTLK